MRHLPWCLNCFRQLWTFLLQCYEPFLYVMAVFSEVRATDSRFAIGFCWFKIMRSPWKGLLGVLAIINSGSAYGPVFGRAAHSLDQGRDLAYPWMG